MLDTLITSKTRIKLLLKFFLNSNASSYLRNLEGEFGESTNGIRLELNKFEKAGLLQSQVSGNKSYTVPIPPIRSFRIFTTFFLNTSDLTGSLIRSFLNSEM